MHFIHQKLMARLLYARHYEGQQRQQGEGHYTHLPTTEFKMEL
jgi:hypothetical protein